MSFRFPFPAPPDPWTHREEDLTLARTSTNTNPLNKRVGTGDSHGPPTLQKQASADGSSPSPGPTPRKNWVFVDPVAFRYLEDDPTVNVVERRDVLRGYELYLVEQWACSRESPTLVIATHTGDESHSIVVSVLGVPAEENAWSSRLRMYRKSIQQYHARPKSTDLGELMVTNLSSFPSALTVIPVPEGDIRAHRQLFIVNENLKRLGCSGRSGMTLTEPTSATQAKFYQQYRANERISFFEAVLELIKLCQVALFLFGKLEFEYIDGLLCDKTETAIGNWWTELGAEYYNVEPTDGILGPTTVSALLGMLMGARNRLHYLGAPVVKDVFDIANTKRGISWFQKTQKLEKTRRLDRQTILKLHTVTAKAAAGEGWGVQKAVKSTVAEIGGKRGELVIGMVGGRDKGAIGDIETLDIDKFIDITYGERAKWLWYGKPRREKVSVDHTERGAEMGTLLSFGKEEPSQAPSRRAQSLPLEEEVQRARDEPPNSAASPAHVSATSHPDNGSPSEKEALRRGVFKSVAGRVSDARSGLGRIKDTIGGSRRGHASRPSRDDFSESGYGGYSSPGVSAPPPNSGVAASPGAGVNRAFTWRNKPEEYLEAYRKEGHHAHHGPPDISRDHDKDDADGEGARQPSAHPSSSHLGSDFGHPISGAIKEEEPEDKDPADPQRSAVDGDLLGPLEAERMENAAVCYLQRRHSMATSSPSRADALNEARWPRRLSFSDAEEAVLQWDDIAELVPEKLPPPSAENPSKTLLAQAASRAETSRALYGSMYALRTSVSPWVLDKLAAVECLDAHYAREQEDLQALYYQLSESYHRLRQGSSELVAAERARATEAIREVEVLIARLEYEVNALHGKVGDVEDGVRLFERQVEDIEARADELKSTLETESWLHWLVRTVTGIGTGPNITRGTDGGQGLVQGEGANGRGSGKGGGRRAS